jgi:capsular polysaccharide biosynthesis protein
MVALLAGCSSGPPKYEAVAKIAFYSSSVDLKFEASFVRAERFLVEVFSTLTVAEMRVLGGVNEEALTDKVKNQILRRLITETSAAVVENKKQVEIRFLHGDPDFAAQIANKIASVYLSVKDNQAYLAQRAIPPETPVK